jgi:hypothetical protein
MLDDKSSYVVVINVKVGQSDAFEIADSTRGLIMKESISTNIGISKL